MAEFIKKVRRWLSIDDKQGVTAIEYGLIAALIAVAIIGSITALGTTLSTTFNTVASKVSSAGGGG